MAMRRGWWPFSVYAAVVVAHLVLLAASVPAADVTKALLMPSLLVAVLLVVLLTARGSIAGRRGGWAVALLSLGIVASFLGDVLLGVAFVAGLVSFAAAHLLYIALFVGPARAARIPWWSLGYVAVVVPLVIVLWPHLGELRPVVLGYAVVLAVTAIASTGVNATTAWGGGLFLASDALLAFRLFYPGFDAGFPDPWQDLLIMVLYCLGEGLIAFGVLRRLRDPAV